MLALEGVKIIDLTWQGPGPFCTMILGDLGADIIRITPPPTAEARQSRRQTGNRELAHQAFSRNKKSILLDLKPEAGRHIFCQLAEKADVIVEGFRPGVMERLGINYPEISKLNPQIVYCSISGYGQAGPYHSLPGHDINYISFGGALNLIGEAGRKPAIPLNLLADYGGGGMSAVIGILSALIARDKTGRGQHVDISLTDSVITLLASVAGGYFQTGVALGRGEHILSGVYPFYDAYETKDGKFITLGCLEPWLWANLCRAIGREDFVPYDTVMARECPRNSAEEKKWKEIASYLKELFRTKTRDEWFELLSQKDVPIAKVYSLDEVFSDPQVLHRQMVVEPEHPTEGKIKQVGIAVKLSDTPGKVRSLAPMPGEHTVEVLLSLGYSRQRIGQLRQKGVIW